MRVLSCVACFVCVSALGCGSRTELYNGTTSRSVADGGADGADGETCSPAAGLTVLASDQVSPGYVTVDATHVYWTTQGAGSSGGARVMKVSKCGGAPITIATVLDSPFAIAVDETSVYWTTFDALMKSPLAGGNTTTLASGQIDPYALALGGTNLYWASTNLVSTPALGGTSTTLASMAGQTSWGIAVDATSVYWTQYDGAADGAVMRMPLGGGKPTTLASGLGAVEAIAVDDTSVYWTTSNVSAVVETGVVMKLAKDSLEITTLASMQNIGIISGIASDQTNVYWTTQVLDGKGGTVMKVPAFSGTPTMLASGQGDPQSVAVDETSVYWVNSLGTVMMLTPK